MSLSDLMTPLLLRREVNGGLERLFAKYLKPDMAVYDIGCGTKPFAPVLAGKVARHIGVDLADGFYDPSAIDLVGSAYSVPADDGAADAVILSQVLEHLETPRVAMAECARLLKTGGLLFLSFPFLYPLHAMPRDYFRYTESGAKELMNESGFEIVEMERTGGFWFCAGFFMKVYLQNFDRGILARLYVMKIFIALIQYVCLAFHKLEAFALEKAGKDIAEHRAPWTVNYTYVAKKK